MYCVEHDDFLSDFFKIKEKNINNKIILNEDDNAAESNQNNNAEQNSQQNDQSSNQQQQEQNSDKNNEQENKQNTEQNNSQNNEQKNDQNKKSIIDGLQNKTLKQLTSELSKNKDASLEPHYVKAILSKTNELLNPVLSGKDSADKDLLTNVSNILNNNKISKYFGKNQNDSLKTMQYLNTLINNKVKSLNSQSSEQDTQAQNQTGQEQSNADTSGQSDSTQNAGQETTNQNAENAQQNTSDNTNSGQNQQASLDQKAKAEIMKISNEVNNNSNLSNLLTSLQNDYGNDSNIKSLIDSFNQFKNNLANLSK